MVSGKKLRDVALLTAVSCSVSFGLLFSGALLGFELKAHDILSRHLNPVDHDPGIVIIQVDQQSIDVLSREGITWPWPRQVYAPLVEHLSEAEAVFMDILFTESSSYGSEDDAALASAARRAGNVFLPIFLTNTKPSISPGDRPFLEEISVQGRFPYASRFTSAVLPVAVLRQPLQGAGNVTMPPDEDGVYRRVPLLFRAGEYTVPHFVLSHLLRAGAVTLRQGNIYRGDEKIPLDEGRLLLRYSRAEPPFPAFSAVEILQAHLGRGAEKEPAMKRADFRGKKVFIGLTAAGLYDLKPTSLASVATGVHIHATTLDNLLHGRAFRPVPRIATVLFGIVAALGMSAAVLRFLSLFANLAVLAGSLALTIGIPAALFWSGRSMEIIPPSLTLVISFIITAAYSYATEGRQRRFVRRVFSQYMDETIVEHILRHPAVIRPGGHRERVTVFFADIAGFTTLSERLSPEETAQILHTVLNSFTEVIIHNRGVIDKYIGDAVMAFWGAPVSTGEDEVLACRAALQCLAELREINSRFSSEGLPALSVRVGIHSGDAIVGNLGSDRLFDYTVVGDTVNTASRLESVNKVFHTAIIASGETISRTGNAFVTRELGMVEVKGKNLATRICEVIAETPEPTVEKQAAVELFHRGLGLFNQGQWAEAKAVFEQVLRDAPDDGPAGFYLERTGRLLANPPAEDWQTIRLTEK